ncbi:MULTISPECIES: hypothetical protein [Cyanophyceae]|uniref:hypothetical protein n=1 Tax=Cyanophyceae TaxID=3028117 RepID=UPI001686B251|nr:MULTISPECIES: hypothetical protein [Cyanophyceae]MBD1919442.1 hypothetical protein [Phormidium sp. FACHB-77]MBD2054294.1 hypothetical protein [Leptolyngbya sp. FACHB-60]
MRHGVIWLLKMIALVGLIPIAVGGYRIADYYLSDSLPTSIVWFLSVFASVLALQLYNHYLGGMFFQLDIDKSIRHIWIVVCVVKWTILFGLGVISIPLCVYFSYSIFLHQVGTSSFLSWALGGFFGFGISLVLQESLVVMYRNAIAEKVGTEYPHRRK